LLHQRSSQEEGSHRSCESPSSKRCRTFRKEIGKVIQTEIERFFLIGPSHSVLSPPFSFMVYVVGSIVIRCNTVQGRYQTIHLVKFQARFLGFLHSFLESKLFQPYIVNSRNALNVRCGNVSRAGILTNIPPTREKKIVSQIDI
jgi:hypothetical protein